MGAKQAERVTTIGRGGIKIPDYQWHERRDPRYQIDNFLLFFHRLWEANDIDLVTEVEAHFSTNRKKEQVSMLEELVLPPSGTKPLTVVRATYTPELRSTIKYRAESDRRRPDYDQLGYTIGTEEHKLLISPTAGSLQFVPILSLKKDRRIGGHEWGSNVQLRWQGEHVYTDQLEVLAGEYPDADTRREASRQAIAESLKPVLADIISFMSE